MMQYFQFSILLSVLCVLLGNGSILAQVAPTTTVIVQDAHPPKPPYSRKEEIIYDGKRYRIYNNYLTLGAGFANSNIRTSSQKCIGIDYNWHIRRQYFQTGVMMSGGDFGDNNNIQAHFAYGLRHERNTSNFALFLGPSFSTGVEGAAGSPAVFYDTFGMYGSAQAVSKFLFDIGLGLEIFGDVSPKQSLFGFKIIAFFSGAYKGEKRNYNPNVRSENP